MSIAAIADEKPVQPAARRRIKQLEVIVSDVIAETPDTTTLVLFTGNDSLEYRAGHFLTIDPHQFPMIERWTAFLEDVKGKKEPARAYSLTSAPYEKYLSITVKEELYVRGMTQYPPLLSPVLVGRLRVGSRMVITGFTGPYVLPEDLESQTDHMVHVCAGSGIVPNWSIIKEAFHRGMKVKHTLVYGNKTWDDIILRDEIEAFRKKHPKDFHVIHALSREADISMFGDNVVKGRVTKEILASVMPDPTAVQVYACGPALSKYDKRRAKKEGQTPPPRFMETTLALFDELKIPQINVHYESYG